MCLDVTLLLREFARRPTIDRPERTDPGLDVSSLDIAGLMARIFRPLSEPEYPASLQDYSADARWASLLDH